MDIRVEVQQDHKSESLRYVATAIVDGLRRKEAAKYGGTEVREELFREVAEWLTEKGYDAPDHYWLQTFPK